MSRYTTRLRYYEDIPEGETFESIGRTVTEADIMAYAGVSGDFSRLHTDEEYMKTTPFGGRIAHGLLTFAISSGLAQVYFNEVAVQAHLESSFKFEHPVRAGDTIRILITAGERRETKNPGRGIIKFKREILNQRAERTSLGATTLMIGRRPKTV
jgi:acyl dehydratase